MSESELIMFFVFLPGVGAAVIYCISEKIEKIIKGKKVKKEKKGE